MRLIATLVFTSLAATFLTSCTRDVQAMSAQQIEQRYGLSGAYVDTIATADGPIKGTLVPITLADGSQGHLFIPQRAASAPEAVYVMDPQGLHPVRLGDNVSRTEVTRAPVIVERRAAVQQPKARSWEKEVLIIGGSAGAGNSDRRVDRWQEGRRRWRGRGRSRWPDL